MRRDLLNCARQAMMTSATDSSLTFRHTPLSCDAGAVSLINTRSTRVPRFNGPYLASISFRLTFTTGLSI